MNAALKASHSGLADGPLDGRRRHPCLLVLRLGPWGERRRGGGREASEPHDVFGAAPRGLKESLQERAEGGGGWPVALACFLTAVRLRERREAGRRGVRSKNSSS